MKLLLESTDKLITIFVDGHAVPARIWQGRFAGVEIHAFITRVAIPTGAPGHVHREFEREFVEQAPARADVSEIPLRLIL